MGTRLGFVYDAPNGLRHRAVSASGRTLFVNEAKRLSYNLHGFLHPAPDSEVVVHAASMPGIRNVLILVPESCVFRKQRERSFGTHEP
jgi:hypothetical protein